MSIDLAVGAGVVAPEPPGSKLQEPGAGAPGPNPETATKSDRPYGERKILDVLVVDDDPETLEAVAEAIELEGLAVRRATSGREALRLATERPPDLAVVDLIMPEVSGEDVCIAFRRDPRCAKTRLLVLSAAEDTRLVAASCDADGAIMKPFTTALLLHEVRRLLSAATE